MKKYICVHGHFYQPPRENPWLEEIELQESAEPFHDWNERINAECYYPNAVSRVLDSNGRITDILNNYEKISFNFGPTLLSWMKDYAPNTYQGILEGDKQSQAYFNGHGSALAQVYNHIIMPLATRRDKETQVIWGLEDFESRFGRKAEGIWLAETAVDIETLEVLAEHKLKFTILAPRQAKRFRKIGTQEWQDGINTRRPYLCKLPSGKKITLFFYDGEVSQAVAFKGLLDDGKRLADYLLNSFGEDEGEPQLVNIATDGESYGHHHHHGDMALAYGLKYIEETDYAKLTNYSEYLSLYPPEYEAEIHENSSWSCVHGIERWRSDCGCNTGGRNEWNQKWRISLREALDWLRDQLDKVYEDEMGLLTDDVWGLRNRHIQILLDRSSENINRVLGEFIRTELTSRKRTQVMRLLEMQRQCLLMFTSCAWFFDEISGIETVQILQYANRAIQLGDQLTSQDLEQEFINLLSKAESNIPEHKNGGEIYCKFSTPARVNLNKVGTHYAIASLFAEDPSKMDVLNFDTENQYFERQEAGLQKLAIGRTTVISKITLSEKYFSFAVLYLGQHQIIGSSSNQLSQIDFFKMADRIREAFNKSNISDVLQMMQIYFPSKNFSIWELFKDEKIKVLEKILENNLEQAQGAYRDIYDQSYPLMNVMQSAGLKIPPTLRQNLNMVINNEINTFFEETNLQPKKLQDLVKEVNKWDILLNKERIEHTSALRLKDWVEDYLQNAEDKKMQQYIIETIAHLHGLEIYPDWNEIQNLIFKASKDLIPKWFAEAEKNPDDYALLQGFLKLSELINLKLSLPKMSDVLR
jgi:alpha-amylase/alpha-mannosidase (GH57 family)